MDFTNDSTAKFALENDLEAVNFEDFERSGKDNKITKQDVKNKIKQVEKIKNALQGYQGTIPEEDSIKKIIDLARDVYQNETFRFGATEGQYQAGLLFELNGTKWDAQAENIVGYKYVIVEEGSKKRKVRQLPYGLGGREDILIPDLKLIMELKQLANVRDREFCQLLRYMEERRKYSEWGEETKGLVINFGDRTLEIWLVQYKEGQLERIKMHEVEKTPFKDLVKSYKR